MPPLCPLGCSRSSQGRPAPPHPRTLMGQIPHRRALARTPSLCGPVCTCVGALCVSPQHSEGSPCEQGLSALLTFASLGARVLLQARNRCSINGVWVDAKHRASQTQNQDSNPERLPPPSLPGWSGLGQEEKNCISDAPASPLWAGDGKSERAFYGHRHLCKARPGDARPSEDHVMRASITGDNVISASSIRTAHARGKPTGACHSGC